MGERRVGQVFIIGAVLFSGLIVLGFLPLGPSVSTSATPDFREYFQQSFREQTQVFNSAISDNRSIDNVKQEIYGFNRFQERRTSNKGISFSTYQLAVLPEKGKAVFINYRSGKLDTRLYIDGTWTNKTLDAKQYQNKSFSSEEPTVRLILPDLNHEYNFDTSSPRLVYWMKMDFGDETWENSYLG